ncbi:MAG: outer membrane beta-barrel protein [Chloroflexi bacterium]|nr:outer membrane beta-barrel protein [Chloroflexota bacterium]
MKFNKWTLALAAAGVVSLGSVVQAEEQHQVLTALSQTTLSGYVDTSAIWKVGTGNAALPGRAYDGAGKVDGFNLNVVKLALSKPLDEGEWAAGYNFSLLFGPDSVTYQGFGGIGKSAAAFTDLSIQNANIDLRAPVGNGLDIKVGVFESPLGYEPFDAASNPNYSRSYGYVLGPKQHTGVLLSYHLTDWASIYGGVANTHTSAINGRAARAGAGANSPVESEKTYIGGLTLTAPESFGFLKDTVLYGGVVDGLNGFGKDTTSTYVGVTVPTPLEGLSVGAAWDYRFNDPGLAAAPAAAASNWAQAIAGYIQYQATEKLKINNRIDYTTGTDGTFYDRINPSTGIAGTSDLQNKLLSNTLTVDYSLWANVITRAEVRWDHSLAGDQIYGGSAGFADADNNAFTVAANIIYKF